MRTIALIAALLLTQTLYAQQPATDASTRSAIGGLIGAETVGDLILVDPSSKPTLQSVGIIRINAGAKNVSVSAFRFVGGEWDLIEARELQPLVFAIEKAGNWLVDIDGQGVEGKTRFALIVGLSQPPPDVPPPVGDFTQLGAKSKALATAMNDRETALTIAATLDLILKRPPPADIVAARALVTTGIDQALLSRPVASRGKDWLNGWRKPVSVEIIALADAGKLPTSEEYFRAIKVLSESLK